MKQQVLEIGQAAGDLSGQTSIGQWALGWPGEVDRTLCWVSFCALAEGVFLGIFFWKQQIDIVFEEMEETTFFKIEDFLQKRLFVFFSMWRDFWRYQLRLVICFFQVLLAHEGRKGEPRDRVVLLAKFLGSSSAVWTNTLEVTRRILVCVDGMYKFEIHYFPHAGGCVLGVVTHLGCWDWVSMPKDLQ